jgi:hypothetical protein
MRYFTPDLFLRLNSSNSETVDKAVEQWEKAIVSYKKRLQKIQREMPSQLRSIAKLSLHDWSLLKIEPKPDADDLGGAAPSAFIVLKHNTSIITLWYSLARKLQVIDAPQGWPLSRKRVHWLYDELDSAGDDEASFVHRILFSDGTTLFVPFTSCGILQVRSDHAMSHSELMQIA